MIIELRGVEFENKGAELMLYAILEQVRKEIPDAVFVMEKRKSASIHKQRSVGIHTKLNMKKYGIDTALWGKLIPKALRIKIGFVLETDIDVVLDGSGFAFGDFWGEGKAGDRLANHIEKWKKQGKKIILLSQAFGAFTNVALRKKMQIILDNSDLVFARDKYSFNYLNEVPGRKVNLILRPDFTNLISGEIPHYFNKIDHQIAIIPNNKLLESSVFSNRDEYLRFLKEIIVSIEDAGKKPFFLIHEGQKDFALAEDVNLKYKMNTIILKVDNPLHVKGIIGESYAVITSRFHGLVSALAQGVPCLCIGWSHKYLALMEDYNYSKGLLSDSELTGDDLKAKLDMILNQESSLTISSQLKTESVKQKELSKDMWKQVFKVIK